MSEWVVSKSYCTVYEYAIVHVYSYTVPQAWRARARASRSPRPPRAARTSRSPALARRPPPAPPPTRASDSVTKRTQLLNNDIYSLVNLYEYIRSTSKQHTLYMYSYVCISTPTESILKENWALQSRSFSNQLWWGTIENLKFDFSTKIKSMKWIIVRSCERKVSERLCMSQLLNVHAPQH